MNGKEGISGMKVILALLYSKGHSGHFCEGIVSRTKLEKLLFLLERECLPLKDCMLEAHNHRACSDKACDDTKVPKNYSWIDSEPWEYYTAVEAPAFGDHWERAP